MSTMIRTDRVSGYKWADFYVDQSARWVESIEWWPGTPEVGSPVDITGYTGRLVVIRAGFDTTPVLDITVHINGPLGRISWDVHADVMAAFVHPVYQHELTLFPSGNEGLAIKRLKGRVLVRASVLQVTAPPPTTGTGYGQGPYGSGPYGGNA